jgi:hypothetical protein
MRDRGIVERSRSVRVSCCVDTLLRSGLRVLVPYLSKNNARPNFG